MLGGGRKAGDIPPSPRDPMGEFRGGTPYFQSNLPVSHHVSSSSTSGRGHPDRGRVRLSSCQYPEGGLSYHPSPKLLWEANQARAKLTQELTERCRHKKAKQARRHARWWAQMIDQTDATLQEVFSQASLMEVVKLLPWCISAVVPFCYIGRAITIAVQQDEGISIISNPCPTASQPQPELHGLPVPGPSGGVTPPPGTSPLPMSSLPDITLAGTPLVGHPFADLLAIPSKGKQDHSPSDSLDHHHTKRTHITSPEVEVGSEYSSTQDDDHILDLTPETRTGSRWQRQESYSPFSSPIRGLADPDDEVVAGSSKSTKDQTSSDSGSSRGNSLWRLWISIQTQKKYRKRVRASCKLSKGSDWMEAQMKRIGDSHQDVWDHDHKIIRTEWIGALAEDCTSFEMRRMTTRTDQLLHIAEATGSKIYTREPEAETCSLAKALVLSLKQFHTHYYRLYEKGITRAMVGLQGLHMSDAFWGPTIWASMGLKSFCPWCFKFRGNTETINPPRGAYH